MKLVLGRNSLLSAIARVAKVSPTNVPNPVLTYAKLETVDGELFISATDLATRIVVQAEGTLKIVEPGRCLLPAGALTQALRASSADYVGLSTDESETDVSIGIGATTYRWKSLPPDHFPDILSLNTQAESHTLNRESFLAAIKTARTALPRGGDPRFDQVNINQGWLQAADGVRYQQVYCSDAALLSASLPAAFVSDVITMANAAEDEKLTLELNESHNAISVRIGKVSLMTRAHAEAFPDISQVFVNAKMTNQDALYVNVIRRLSDAVRRVRMMADPESGAVAIKLPSGAQAKHHNIDALVSAKLQNGSRATEVVPLTYPGPERTLVVHHEHLLGLLGLFEPHTDANLMLGPDSKTKPGSIYVSDDQRTGVIMQLRMGWHDSTL